MYVPDFEVIRCFAKTEKKKGGGGRVLPPALSFITFLFCFCVAFFLAFSASGVSLRRPVLVFFLPVSISSSPSGFVCVCLRPRGIGGGVTCVYGETVSFINGGRWMEMVWAART